MKNRRYYQVFLAAVIAVTVFAMTGCAEPGSEQYTPELTGWVSISGKAEVGQTLTANTGSLGGSGTISYQWKIDGAVIGSDSTYNVESADIGSVITVTVTRSGYSGSVTSQPTAVVTDTEIRLPYLTGSVSIIGDPIAGKTLTVNTDSLGGEGTIFYQWNRGGNVVGNDDYYYVQDADAGYTITVTVTRSGNWYSVTSGPTDVVVLLGLTGDDAADFGVATTIDNTFDVGTAVEWNDAVSAITSGGNGKNYIINIVADFFIEGVNTNTFGNVNSVKVSIRGEGRTMTLSSGGNIIRAGSGQTVIQRDITLCGITSTSNSMVSVSGDGTFTMQSGKITGNKSEGISGKLGGGGVYVSDRGTFTMNGGEISGNTGKVPGYENGIGGGVYVDHYGTTFTMNGGVISDNTASYGGGVYVAYGTFTMNGGIISGNTAYPYSSGGGASEGGGVLNHGTFIMNGGVISGNTASYGGGVAGTFRIVNGTIYGSNEADESLRNSRTALYVYNSRMTGEFGIFNGSTWNMNGLLGTTEDTIRVVDGVLLGATPIPDNHVFNVANTSEWNNARNSIAAYGSNKNCTINVTADFSVEGRSLPIFGGASGVTVTIQGAGRTLTLSSNGNMLRIGEDQTVIMEDITLQGRASNSDSLVYVDNYSGGTFTMNGGVISGNTIAGVNLDGGGVYVGVFGAFTMNGGEISGNTASYGGGVCVSRGGTFTMDGGKISGNTASSGGGVFLFNEAALRFVNGTISGNTASYGGGGVSNGGTFNMDGGTISGNNGGSGVYNGGTFNMDGGTISGNNGGGVSVSGGTFRIVNGIIYGLDETDTGLANSGRTLNGTAEYGTFSGGSWNGNGTLNTTDEDTIRVVNGVLIVIPITSMPDGHIFNVATRAEWNTAVRSIATYGSNKNYTINVTADFSVAGHTTASFSDADNITVTLQGLAGRTLTLSGNGSLLRTGSGQTVILKDLTLRGHASNNGFFVYVGEGTFIMSGGEISGNTASNDSGGVLVANSGTFTMSGGTISGNTAPNYGGGVYVSGGTFTMSGGTISGNTASLGGGVFVSGGTFTMSGGTISGNTATSGGGVFVSSGTFTMSGGEISGNTASYNGGGVHVSMGTFRMVNGTIYGNTESVTSLRNTSGYESAALYRSGTAQRGTFEDGEWASKGTLTTTDNTIRVVNGVLQL
jgi:hypothetical protein